MEFSGTPQKYKRYAILSSVILNLYLYFGLAGVLYWHSGATWLFTPKPIIVTVLFTVWFAWMSYRWIMRLDAQYGTGKGWELESRMLKLPERRIRR